MIAIMSFLTLLDGGNELGEDLIEREDLKNDWRTFDLLVFTGSCHKRKKNHKRQRCKCQSVTAKREKSQTPKFVTAVLSLTYITIGLPIIWLLRTLAFATFLVWRLEFGVCGVGACGFWRYRMHSIYTYEQWCL